MSHRPVLRDWLDETKEIKELMAERYRDVSLGEQLRDMRLQAIVNRENRQRKQGPGPQAS